MKGVMGGLVRSAVGGGFLAALFACFGLGGCAITSSETTQRLEDGRYELKCEGSLARCLDRVDEICRGTRYRVLQGTDNRDYVGPQEHFEREVRTSHAIIRCGSRGKPLFDSGDKDPASSAEGSGVTTSMAMPFPRACVPGTTQPCVGPAACAGGQACLPDGSGFASCDCGSASRAGSDAMPPTLTPSAPLTPPLSTPPSP